MAHITDFNYFDPSQELTVTYSNLPHWEQPGATYFITFRTNDSLPTSAMKLWERERDQWLARQTKDHSPASWHDKYKRLNNSQRQIFNREFRHKLESILDDSHGDCILRHPAHATVVADSLHHFDGDRYALGDFIVMPNHAHLLVCFYIGIRLREQCYQWKHFMASAINRIRGVKETIWQTESFDHLVRDLEHFRTFQQYIRTNPSKAGLKENEYHLHTID